MQVNGIVIPMHGGFGRKATFFYLASKLVRSNCETWDAQFAGWIAPRGSTPREPHFYHCFDYKLSLCRLVPQCACSGGVVPAEG